MPGDLPAKLAPGYALLIGLSNFAGEWKPLGGGELPVPKRLRDLARVLLEKQNFEGVWIVSDTDLPEVDAELREDFKDKIRILKPSHPSETGTAESKVLPDIELCPNSEAARLSARSVGRQIREFLIRRGNQPRSRILLYYAGHGEADGAEGFLVGGCEDTKSPTSKKFRLESTQTRDLASWVRLAKAEQVLTIVDSCFAGSVFVEPSGIRTDIPTASALRYPVRQFIVAGGHEVTPANSVFTRMLIETLDGRRPDANANADAYLSATEIGAYLRAQVPAELQQVYNDPTPATPRFGELPDPSLNQGLFAFESEPGGTKRTNLEFGDRIGLVREVPFRDCATCPWMLLIPPPPPNAPSYRDSCPSSTYAISQQEITVGEWRQCEPCRRLPLPAANDEAENLPVTGVTAEAADVYVGWLRDRAGHDYQLPTDEEWRCAAGNRAEGAKSSPMANCRGCGGRSNGTLLPAGSFPANEFGLYDMIGNAWEWIRDSDDRTMPLRCTNEARLAVRGGSFSNGPEEAVVGDRGRRIPCDTRSAAVGFRVVRVP